MNKAVSAPSHSGKAQNYPAYCFNASPTYNKWIKLTNADVHALRREPNFDPQGIFFHLNHPIRFFYLCGIITEIDFIPAKDGQILFTILLLDDGSGATVEVKIEHILQKTKKTRQGDASVLESQVVDEDDNFWLGNAREQRMAGPLASTVLATRVEGLTVTTNPSTDHVVRLGKEVVDIGTTIKAKGTLGIWRDNFQLSLRRAFIVSDIDTEVEVWEDYAAFCKQVLCKPWVLTSREVKRLEREDRESKAQEEMAKTKVEKRQKAKREKEKERRKVWEEKMKRHEARREKRRRIEEVELNGRPLKGL